MRTTHRPHPTHGRLAVLLLLLGVIASTLGLVAETPAHAAANTMRLAPNEQLNPGQRLISTDGRFTLEMQGDGNLVLYVPGHIPKWASNTSRYPGSMAIMQGDGNLVVYAPGHVPVWASNTAGRPGAMLDLQADGNLVIYTASRQPLWASNTVYTGGGGSTGGGGRCAESLELWLLRNPSGATTNMRLKVREVKANCAAATRVYRTGSGNGGRDSCTTSNWLPLGDWAIGNYRNDDVRGYFANGHGTLAGRATFDLKLLSTPLSCARPRQAAGTFAIHTEPNTRVGSTSTSSSYVTAGCVKLSGADMTDFYRHWAALPTIPEGGVRLHVVNTSSLPPVSGWA